ncbi:MAG: glycosyltransferase, partial [Deltaproteobacteria bacterium]|nr:glycosyltransferase [Deltaproteobacteria bacterium]
CDGGSSDSSQQIVAELAVKCRFPVSLIQTRRGRGIQMNAGAALATAELLLFLHADSRFDECDALCKAFSLYQSRIESGAQLFAARFALQFLRSELSPALSWFYYEAKARLPRNDCIRGDQGFLLNRAALWLAGGLDQSLPFLEDIRLVETLATRVDWLLLPSTISTSARRFEREGLLERQVLNAIIVNSVVAEWAEFFQALPGLYKCHSDTGRLLLQPLLVGINRLINDQDPAWRRIFWQTTGYHVAGNAWQLFFWLDVRHSFRAGEKPGAVKTHWLEFYQSRLTPFFQSRPAAFMAQIAVKLWLRWMLFHCAFKMTPRQQGGSDAGVHD